MTGALEKAARAACEIDGGTWDDPKWPPHVVAQVQSEYIAEARAVLMAVRSLSAEDLDGACKLAHMDRYTVNTAWIATMQQILNEEPK